MSKQISISDKVTRMLDDLRYGTGKSYSLCISEMHKRCSVMSPEDQCMEKLTYFQKDYEQLFTEQTPSNKAMFFAMLRAIFNETLTVRSRATRNEVYGALYRAVEQAWTTMNSLVHQNLDSFTKKQMSQDLEQKKAEA